MAFPFKVVIYINGVRFDVTSASYTSEDGGEYYFSVDVPAVPEWDILPERSHGALFFTDPVTQTWRFMGEGEYVSTTKGKSADGARSRSLFFRGIHGWWNQANYASILALSAANRGSSGDFSNQITLLRAFGTNIPYAGSPQDDFFRVSSLIDLINISLGNDKDGAVSTFVPRLIRNIALQTPVEAFYLQSRRLLDKMFAFPDKQITGIIDIFRYRDMLQNGSNTFGLGPTTPLDQIIRMYEDLIFYKRVALPAPFMFDGASKIMELIWVPHLYTVQVPVCNVIFDAQMIANQEQRNFMTEPTRAVAQIDLSLQQTATKDPYVFMANRASVFDNQSLAAPPGAKQPNIAATHDFLSDEELLKGVIVTPVSLGLEKITNTGSNAGVNPKSTLPDYIEEGVKHLYFVEQSKSRNKNISTIFLPYIVPGFPCLCEDKTGPVFGIVASLTHTLPVSGKPTTSVRVSHVRPAYIQGADRSPIYPKWINDIFKPAQVETTFTNLLGILPNKIGTQQNPTRNYTSIMQGKTTKDQDRAAANIIAIPTYADNFTEGSDGYDVDTVSKKLAMTPNPALSYLQFQYREGMSLSDYAIFHGFDFVNDSSAFETQDLNPNMNNGDAVNPDPLFASPEGLQYVGVGNTGNAQSVFGIYNLVGGLSPIRQNAARTIAAAIAKVITAN